MSAAHTPGPWSYREQGEANEYLVLDGRGNWLACIKHNGEQTVERQRANLAAMTAGPDLLAALRELHRVCVAMDHPDQMQRPEEEEYLAAVAGAAAALQLVDGQ